MGASSMAMKHTLTSGVTAMSAAGIVAAGAALVPVSNSDVVVPMASVSGDYQLTAIEDLLGSPLRPVTLFFGDFTGDYYSGQYDVDDMPFDAELGFDLHRSKGIGASSPADWHNTEALANDNGGVATDNDGKPIVLRPEVSGPAGALYYVIDNVLPREFVVDDYFYGHSSATLAIKAALLHTGSDELAALGIVLDLLSDPVGGAIALLEGTGAEFLTFPLVFLSDPVGTVSELIPSMGDLGGLGGVFGTRSGDDGDDVVALAKVDPASISAVQTIAPDNEIEGPHSRALTDRADGQKVVEPRSSDPISKLRTKLAAQSDKLFKKGGEGKSRLDKRVGEVTAIGRSLVGLDVVGAAAGTGEFVRKRIERAGKDLSNGASNVVKEVQRAIKRATRGDGGGAE